MPSAKETPTGARSTERTPGVHLAAMRERAPLVQCITNFVAMNTAANVLLAAGASPAMLHAAEETLEFTPLAQALSINIGTPSPHWAAGMKAAAGAARAAGLPWVLDPVAVGATSYRQALCGDLLALEPAVIRGNASEILALAGAATRGKGADSADPVEAAEAAARALAQRSWAVVAVTGPVDYVTDGTRAWRVHNGDPMMPKVTALGCSLTALVAAFVAVEAADRAEATVAALACFGLAGEIAARGASGPGSFAVALIDALHAMTPEALDLGARVEPS
ncbi:hydroxyethylthiazole kinase [Rhodovulum kholense]|uniref:Hydroxyethylthiazole kinase n=1 Tax=Rhodovulum kholense TaxID=453584 RepID=A0A8E3AT20_9RHOB|nr:hydroxyethylthiazole kinase [Rhodovulum kholense]PTW51756.1 hydroxyethylthiazole kinase [Rhodovulum kholense]